jgi:hypothetical protein
VTATTGRLSGSSGVDASVVDTEESDGVDASVVDTEESEPQAVRRQAAPARAIQEEHRMRS